MGLLLLFFSHPCPKNTCFSILFGTQNLPKNNLRIFFQLLLFGLQKHGGYGLFDIKMFRLDLTTDSYPWKVRGCRVLYVPHTAPIRLKHSNYGAFAMILIIRQVLTTDNVRIPLCSKGLPLFLLDTNTLLCSYIDAPAFIVQQQITCLYRMRRVFQHGHSLSRNIVHGDW